MDAGWNGGGSGAVLDRVAEADDAWSAVGAHDRPDQVDTIYFDVDHVDEGVDIGGETVADSDVLGVRRKRVG